MTHIPHVWTNGEIVTAALLNALENDLTTASGIQWAQTAPAAVWIVPHQLGRLPTAAVYDVDGVAIAPDVHASVTSVTFIFAFPTAGTAVLT